MADNKDETKKEENNQEGSKQRQADNDSLSWNSNKSGLIETLCSEQHTWKRR